MRKLLASLLVLYAPSAAAQVNVEPLRAKLKDDGVAASVDVKLSGRTGNNQGLTAGGSGLVGARSEPHFGFVSANGDFASYFGEVQAARYFTHARYNYTLLPSLWWELFGQLEHDRFARLTLRKLVGTGPRVSVLGDNTDDVQLFASTAYMLEHESLDLPPEAQDLRSSTVHRSSSTVAGLFRVDERVVVVLTALYQPRFDRPRDYRMLGIASAEFAVGKRVAASINVRLRHDSAPPTGVLSTDLGIDNQLGLRF